MVKEKHTDEDGSRSWYKPILDFIESMPVVGPAFKAIRANWSVLRMLAFWRSPYGFQAITITLILLIIYIAPLLSAFDIDKTLIEAALALPGIWKFVGLGFMLLLLVAVSCAFSVVSIKDKDWRLAEISGLKSEVDDLAKQRRELYKELHGKDMDDRVKAAKIVADSFAALLANGEVTNKHILDVQRGLENFGSCIVAALRNGASDHTESLKSVCLLTNTPLLLSLQQAPFSPYKAGLEETNRPKWQNTFCAPFLKAVDEAKAIEEFSWVYMDPDAFRSQISWCWLNQVQFEQWKQESVPQFLHDLDNALNNCPVKKKRCLEDPNWRWSGIRVSMVPLVIALIRHSDPDRTLTFLGMADLRTKSDQNVRLTTLEQQVEAAKKAANNFGFLCSTDKTVYDFFKGVFTRMSGIQHDLVESIAELLRHSHSSGFDLHWHTQRRHDLANPSPEDLEFSSVTYKPKDVVAVPPAGQEPEKV